LAVEEEILHEGSMPGAVIYISEFQNKVLGFDIADELRFLHHLRGRQVLYHLGRIVFIHVHVVFGVIWQILSAWLNLSHRFAVSCGLPLSGRCE
jgi:hypothetical protein